MPIPILAYVNPVKTTDSTSLLRGSILTNFFDTVGWTAGKGAL